MHQIIPSINCHVGESDCVMEKIAIAKKINAPCVHLDICDGAFTFNKTWNSPKEWKRVAQDISSEVHLMVEYPERIAELWLQSGVKRLIIHAEALLEAGSTAMRVLEDGDALEYITQLAEAYEASIMIAINPETPVEVLRLFAPRVREFQVLAVTPGLPGQKFLPVVLEKIALVRAQYPKALIEIDGGITPEHGACAIAAGANNVVSASYIFSDNNPQEAYDRLQKCDTAVNKQVKKTASARTHSRVSLKK